MIQEAQAAAQTMSSGELVTSQLAGAALLAYLLQWLKATRLVPFISEHTKGINRALTGIMSLAASIGIHYNFDSTAGILTIGGLHAGSILHGLWAWAQQWAFQQGAADMIFTRQVAKETAEADQLPISGTGDGK